MPRFQNDELVLQDLQSGQMKYKQIQDKHGISYSVVKRIEKQYGVVNANKSMNKSINISVNQSVLPDNILQEEKKENHVQENFLFDNDNFFQSPFLDVETSQLKQQKSESESESESQRTLDEDDEESQKTTSSIISGKEIQPQQIEQQEVEEQQIVSNKSFVDFMNNETKPIKSSETFEKLNLSKISTKEKKLNRSKLDLSKISTKEKSFSFANKQQIPKDAELTGKECFIIQIRKYMQHFKEKEEIWEIVGKTKQQHQQFIKHLPFKTEEQLKFIRDTIKFELLLSQMDQKQIPENIKQFLQLIEAGLKTVGVDVVGCADELFADESFKFYLTMVSCEITYLPTPKQMVFFKFIKSYYKKYMQNKQKNQMEQKLQQPVNTQLIELSKQLI